MKEKSMKLLWRETSLISYNTLMGLLPIFVVLSKLLISVGLEHTEKTIESTTQIAYNTVMPSANNDAIEINDSVNKFIAVENTATAKIETSRSEDAIKSALNDSVPANIFARKGTLLEKSITDKPLPNDSGKSVNYVIFAIQILIGVVMFIISIWNVPSEIEISFNNICGQNKKIGNDRRIIYSIAYFVSILFAVVALAGIMHFINDENTTTIVKWIETWIIAFFVVTLLYFVVPDKFEGRRKKELFRMCCLISAVATFLIFFLSGVVYFLNDKFHVIEIIEKSNTQVYGSIIAGITTAYLMTRILWMIIFVGLKFVYQFEFKRDLKMLDLANTFSHEQQQFICWKVYELMKGKSIKVRDWENDTEIKDKIDTGIISWAIGLLEDKDVIEVKNKVFVSKIEDKDELENFLRRYSGYNVKSQSMSLVFNGKLNLDEYETALQNFRKQKYKVFHEKIDDLQKQVIDKEDTIETLKKQLKEKENRITHLCDAISDIKDVKAACESIKEKIDNINRLEERGKKVDNNQEKRSSKNIFSKLWRQRPWKRSV